jgi:type IV pilus biogenesis protein CpaD/CtpE
MRISAVLLLSMASIALTGCYPDPFQNPSDWSMTGATRKNLAAQAANPSDLIEGRSELNSNGVAASAAIDKALGGAAGTAAGLQTPPSTTSLDITGS